MNNSLIYLSRNFLLFVILLCSTPVFAQGRAVISIPAEVRVEADTITLGDIAAITGADEKTTNRLKRVSLGYAPAVATASELDLARISLAINAAGFDRSRFVINAPAKIAIRRASQFVERDELREAVIKAVSSLLERENVKANFTGFEIPGGVEAPTGKVEIIARADDPVNFSGHVPVSIELRVDGKTYRRFAAAANIEAEVEVLVAARELVRGEKLAPGDLKVETRRLEKPLKTYVRDAGRLRGMVIQKNLSAGEAVTTDSIAPGYVIRAGDMVKIIGSSGKMRITVTGEARASGRVGDRIAVKNSQSGAILQAIVEDEGVVKVNF